MSKMKLLLFLCTTNFYLVCCQNTTDNAGKNAIIETTTTEVTTGIPILFLRDDNGISWSPRSTQSVIIEAVKGYKISVNITDCNIDGENKEYAIITTDENTNGLIFTYGVTTKPAYLYNNTRLFGQFVGSSSSNFTAVFTRIGKALISTTAEIPTTQLRSFYWHLIPIMIRQLFWFT